MKYLEMAIDSLITAIELQPENIDIRTDLEKAMSVYN